MNQSEGRISAKGTILWWLGTAFIGVQSALMGLGLWNLRRGWLLCRHRANERLLDPGNWTALSAMMVVAGLLGMFVVRKGLKRYLRPWALFPAAFAAVVIPWVFWDEQFRAFYNRMFWYGGCSMTLGMILYDQGTLAWVKRKIPLQRRLALGQKLPWVGFAILMIISTASMFWLINYGYRNIIDFQANVYDYANLNQSMWTLANYGRPITTTMNYLVLFRYDFHWWAEHFTPIQYFILPFYYPFQSQSSLNTIQYCMGMVTPIPLIFAVRHQLKSWIPALAIGMCWILHPMYIQVQTILFHYETLFPMFFFGAYYFYVTKRPLGFAVLLFASFTAKESMPLGAMAWGMSTLIFHKGNRKWGLYTFILGVIYYIIGMKIAVEVYRDGVPFATLASRYEHIFLDRGIATNSVGDLVKNSLRYPFDVLVVPFEKFRWVAILKVAAPVGFMFLLRPWTACIFLPQLMMHTLSGFQAQYIFGLYHAVEVLPYFIVAVAVALEKPPWWLGQKGRYRRFLVCTSIALAGVVLASHYSRSQLPTGKMHDVLPPVTKRLQPWAKPLYDFFTQEVPRERRIASLGNAVTGLSGRRWILHFDYPEDYPDDQVMAENGLPNCTGENPHIEMATSVFLNARRECRWRHPWEKYVDDIILVAPRYISFWDDNNITMDELPPLLEYTLKSGKWQLYQPYDLSDDSMGVLWLTRDPEGDAEIENVDAILEHFFDDHYRNSWENQSILWED